MAEKDDPFDIAMASLDELMDEPSSDEATLDDRLGAAGDDSEKTTNDPFEAALAAMEDAGGSGQKARKTGKATDPFEAAMQAMQGGENVNTATIEIDKEDDPFAAALEVAKAEHKIAAAHKTGSDEGKPLDLDFLMEIKLNLTFEVGRTKMYISDLLSLGQGSVIELHRLVGEELELYVNGQLLATGEVVVVNEKFGARISRILSPEDRVTHLGPQLVTF
jgi:flagellar motor switch protein FliN